MLFAKTPEPTAFTTRLLPEVFDLKRLAEGESVRVIDLGPARGETILFLGQFNSRYHVADIVAELKKLNQRLAADEDLGDEEILEHLRGALNLEAGDTFDVCLFWDVFNYLDLRVLPLFARLLLPHLAPKARAYGFAVLNKNTPLCEQSYGVINSELLSVSPVPRVGLPFSHSQSAIKDAISGIAIKQSILRSDGRLEMIFTPL